MKKIYLFAIILLAFSVYMGCKKDDDGGNGCEGITSVEYLGQTYNTIEIGNQCWMAENLNVGTMIQGSRIMFDDGFIDKYCYKNDTVNCNEYGGLYQWNEMMKHTTTASVKGICPFGWHIPTDEEWTILTDFLGGDSIAGGKMKETGTTHWDSPNIDATNESGFTALPSGSRSTTMGSFDNLGYSCTFWSSSTTTTNVPLRRTLWHHDDQLYCNVHNRNMGYSVRCLKDKHSIY